MRLLASTQSQEDPYAVRLPGPIQDTLAALPQAVRSAVLRRLAEIAHVAGTLRSWMTDATDDIHSTLYFQVAGYAVSYALNDGQRALFVMGVVPLTPMQPGPER
jgi:hypothetical protein